MTGVFAVLKQVRPQLPSQHNLGKLIEEAAGKQGDCTN